MLKTILIIFGILLVFGCGESPREQQFSSGCSEGGGSYSEGSYTPADDDSSGGGSDVASWTGTKHIGTSANEIALDITTDKDGNIYIIGYTNGSLDNHTNAGQSDILIIKYDAIGIQQWTKQFGTASSDAGMKINISFDGNFYVTGSTNGNLDGNTNLGSNDIFLIKFDNDWNKQWTKQFGTSSSDQAASITTDSSGNIYVTGYTHGSLDTQVNSGGTDFILFKYNNSGVKQWQKQIGSSASDEGKDLAVDSFGDIYVTGYTLGSFDSNSFSGGYDTFVIKYKSDGNKQWSRQFGTNSVTNPQELVFDNSNNFYITGEVRGDLDGNENVGNTDYFLVKFDINGTKVWTKQHGTDVGIHGSASGTHTMGISSDSFNNIYVTGRTNGQLDGNLHSGIDDIFVTKFNSNGERKWTHQHGSAGVDFPWAIVSDSEGNTHITGYTNENLDGNKNLGGDDIFIIKYDGNGNKQ